MRIGLWALFFVICNIVGVEVFKAAILLPFDEAILPRVLAVPLVGLTALSASRVVGLFNTREK
ncbi:MAG: hypothetical protein HYU41_06795 [Candidatus Rokubacteria bacterium]|nr:hypothetical protein [Candidatus Rokubacteria bacterium]